MVNVLLFLVGATLIVAAAARVSVELAMVLSGASLMVLALRRDTAARTAKAAK